MLERVVRPWQSPGNLATRTIVANNSQVAVSEALLWFGGAGTMPTPTKEVGPGYSIKECDNTSTEKSREVKLKRIENPNDPSQYLMVEDTTKIVFSKKSDAPINKNGDVTMPVDNTSFAPDPTPFFNKCNETYQFEVGT